MARPSRAYRYQDGPQGVGTAVAALAARQHGVVSYAQLLDLGLDKHGIGRRVRSGHLHRVHRGVFAVGHVGLTMRGRELAAVFACGRGAVLSHRSAGRLWELLRSGSAGIDVTASRTRAPRADIVVHTSRALGAADRAVRRAIPVTSPARTLVDLAEVLTDQWLAGAVHEAEVRRLFDLRRIEAAMDRVPGRKGRHRLLRVLAAYRPEDHDLDSEGERRFRELCRHHGLPAPLRTLVEGHQVDFYWPEARLAVEVDGAAFHNTRRAFHSDRARDRALAALGIQVLRVTWPDLDRGAVLMDQVGRVYAERAGAASGHSRSRPQRVHT